jgi:elongation factor G
VKIAFAPAPFATGFAFDNRTDLPAELAAVVERTIAHEKDQGHRHGFPMIDFRAALIETHYQEFASTEQNLARATRGAYRELTASSGMWLMEPILLATVHVLEEFADPALADLTRRRGKILDVEPVATARRIRALVPASDMFGYINVLMPLAEGRARYDAVLDHYAPVPLAGQV